ncbi:MAG: glycerophosphodiester phosphodiesterase family protein [Clostridia bacterium]
MDKFNIISHRGANRYRPQNTIPAFEKSIEIGVDGFETDVHLTKDGQIVLCHNHEIDETSNGKGEISKLTLEQLKRYDFGSYFSEKYAQTKIPTLEEFLTISKAAGIQVLNIEIKSQKERNSEIVKQTIETVKSFDMYDQLLISSFDTDVLIEAKKYDQNCKTGFLISPTQNFSTVLKKSVVETAVKQLGADAIHPFSRFINKALVEQAHEQCLIVNTWTVNTSSNFSKMIQCGVDGLITDYPDVAHGMLSKFF